MNVSSFLELYEPLRGSPHNASVLLGNGFSISLNPNFTYPLLSELDVYQHLHGRHKQLFHLIGGNNFESLMRALEYVSEILTAYQHHEGVGLLRNMLLEDSRELHDCLVQAVKTIHPDLNRIQLYQKESCAEFLSHFRHIFTLNYDLLLNDVLVEEYKGRDYNKLFKDGFSKRRKSTQDDRLWHWLPQNISGHMHKRRQNIYYLHGAFHVVEDSEETYKVVKRTRDATTVIDIVAEKIGGRTFPLIVSGGNAESKENKIAQFEYLRKCFNSLEKLEGGLFVHGCSLLPQDWHIIRAIAESQLDTICYGLFFGTRPIYQVEQDYNRISNYFHNERFKSARRGRPLKLCFYRLDEANAWQDFEPPKKPPTQRLEKLHDSIAEHLQPRL